MKIWQCLSSSLIFFAATIAVDASTFTRLSGSDPLFIRLRPNHLVFTGQPENLRYRISVEPIWNTTLRIKTAVHALDPVSLEDYWIDLNYDQHDMIWIKELSVANPEHAGLLAQSLTTSLATREFSGSQIQFWVCDSTFGIRQFHFQRQYERRRSAGGITNFEFEGERAPQYLGEVSAHFGDLSTCIAEMRRRNG